MPPKRKGATAEDGIEDPPAKINKGNKEADKPWDRVWDTALSILEKNIIGEY